MITTIGWKKWFTSRAKTVTRATKATTHAVLNVAAVPPYATYYAANRTLHAVNGAGRGHGGLNIAKRVVAQASISPIRSILWSAQAGGLGADIALDWIKGRTVATESIRDEGIKGGISPRTR